MTVRDESESIRQVLQGPYSVGDTIDIPFSYGEIEHVFLYKNKSPLRNKIDYEVSGQKAILNVSLEAFDKLVIIRSTPVDNDAEFPQEAEFDSEKINDAIDKLTRQNQEQQEAIDRAVKQDIDTATGKIVGLPIPDPTKCIKWSDDGLSLINSKYDPDSIVGSAESAMQEAQDAAKDAYAALNTMNEKIETVQGELTTFVTEQVDIKVDERMGGLWVKPIYRADYEKLVTKDDNTLYIIRDDGTGDPGSGEDIDISNLVTIDGEQTITGAKTFEQPITAPNIVTLSDDQTITGIKLFSSPVIFQQNIAAPNIVTQTDIADVMKLSEEQTVTGKKTYTNGFVVKKNAEFTTSTGSTVGTEIMFEMDPVIEYTEDGAGYSLSFDENFRGTMTSFVNGRVSSSNSWSYLKTGAIDNFIKYTESQFAAITPEAGVMYIVTADDYSGFTLYYGDLPLLGGGGSESVGGIATNSITGYSMARVANVGCTVTAEQSTGITITGKIVLNTTTNKFEQLVDGTFYDGSVVENNLISACQKTPGSTPTGLSANTKYYLGYRYVYNSVARKRYLHLEANTSGYSNYYVGTVITEDDGSINYSKVDLLFPDNLYFTV